MQRTVYYITRHKVVLRSKLTRRVYNFPDGLQPSILNKDLLRHNGGELLSDLHRTWWSSNTSSGTGPPGLDALLGYRKGSVRRLTRVVINGRDSRKASKPTLLQWILKMLSCESMYLPSI